MTTAAYTLAQKLKNIKPSNGNDRLARSLFMVNSFAMSIPVNTYANAEQAVEATEGLLKKVINEVNEFVSIDTKMVMALYGQLMRIRFELLNGTTDPAIMNMVLRSETATDIKNVEDAAMTQFLISRPGAAEDTKIVNEAISELYASVQ